MLAVKKFIPVKGIKVLLYRPDRPWWKWELVTPSTWWWYQKYYFTNFVKQSSLYYKIWFYFHIQRKRNKTTN